MGPGGETDLHQYGGPDLSYAARMDKEGEAKPGDVIPAAADAEPSGFSDGLSDILMRAHIRHQDLVQELDRLGVLVDPLTGSVTFRGSE
ncbi:MAG: hypothetical protein RLZZ563_1713 [Pseudomonadota bacterium]|jgi:hypothetical protein